tara:strand:- start:20 stop:343 length:324 start_codon:yes stop_codon:yes gene_type:complete
MAIAPFTVNITDNVADTVIDGIRAGQEFTAWIPAGGTIGGATVTISGDSDGSETAAALPGGALTAVDTQKVFTNPSTEGKCFYKVTGASGANFHLCVAPLLVKRVQS